MITGPLKEIFSGSTKNDIRPPKALRLFSNFSKSVFLDVIRKKRLDNDSIKMIQKLLHVDAVTFMLMSIEIPC